MIERDDDLLYAAAVGEAAWDEALCALARVVDGVTVAVSDGGARRLPEADALRVRFGLTLAEARVARLAPLALRRRQLARVMGLSENTIKTHQAAIRSKLGARNAAEAAVIIAGIGVANASASA